MGASLSLLKGGASKDVQTYFKTTTVATEERGCTEGRMAEPVSPLYLLIQQIFTQGLQGLQVVGSLCRAGDLEMSKIILAFKKL